MITGKRQVNNTSIRGNLMRIEKVIELVKESNVVYKEDE